MKKEARVEFGIEIVKPWSQEMYIHNEAVADAVRAAVADMWNKAFAAAEVEFVDEDELGNEFVDMYWDYASEDMVAIQKAVTCYGFGSGYDVAAVTERVLQELEEAPSYHLKSIAEELGIELEKGFVGFK